MRPQPDGTNKYVKPGGSRGRYFSMQVDEDFEQDLETFGSTLEGDWSKAEIVREALARACGRVRTVEILPVYGMTGPRPRLKSGYTQSDREWGGQKVSNSGPGNAEMGPGNTSGNFSEELVEVPNPELKSNPWKPNWSEETIKRLKRCTQSQQDFAYSAQMLDIDVRRLLDRGWDPEGPQKSFSDEAEEIEKTEETE